MMNPVEEFDRPPAGWHALNVMRKTSRKWDWIAIMVDVDPDDLKHCTIEGDGLAVLFVNPYEWQPKPGLVARQCYVRVSGKHRNADAAWEAIHDMIAAGLH